MRARHICLAAELLRSRESSRATFRDVVYQIGETACESGARFMDISYLAHCLMFLGICIERRNMQTFLRILRRGGDAVG
jgi:hypothetical protein